MPIKDPANYPCVTYIWVVGLSAWGSIVSFIRRASVDMPWKKKFQLILAEIIISTFAGMITFFLCEYSNLDKMLSAAFIAVSGHMGTRAIILTEKLYIRFITGATKGGNDEN